MSHHWQMRQTVFKSKIYTPNLPVVRSVCFVLSLVCCYCPAAAQVAVPRAAVDAEPKLDDTLSSSWPRFLGTRIDGAADLLETTDTSSMRTDWSDGGLPLLWQSSVGQGYSIGVVANGKYYHFDKHEDEARLRCLEARTGKQVWEYRYASTYRDLYGYDSGPRSSPLVEDDRIYLFGVEGKLLCLNAEDGRLVWTVDTAEKFGVVQNFFGVASNPVIHQDKLLVMVGGSPPEDQKIPQGQLDKVTSNGACIVAFDKKTGVELYRTGNDLASYSSLTWMGVGDTRMALAWARGAVWGIEPQTGNVKFTFPYRSRKLETVNAMTPLVKGNRFLVSECYELGTALVEVDASGALKVVWSDKGKRDKSLAAHWGTPVLHQGFLYGCSGRHSATADLRCVEWETGKVRWIKRGFKRSSVIRIGQRLVVLGESGRLALIAANPNAFEITTERAADDELRLVANCWAAPIFADGCLYVRDGKKIACFELLQHNAASSHSK